MKMYYNKLQFSNPTEGKVLVVDGAVHILSEISVVHQ